MAKDEILLFLRLHNVHLRQYIKQKYVRKMHKQILSQHLKKKQNNGVVCTNYWGKKQTLSPSRAVWLRMVKSCPCIMEFISMISQHWFRFWSQELICKEAAFKYLRYLVFTSLNNSGYSVHWTWHQTFFLNYVCSWVFLNVQYTIAGYSHALNIEKSM